MRSYFHRSLELQGKKARSGFHIFFTLNHIICCCFGKHTELCVVRALCLLAWSDVEACRALLPARGRGCLL